MVQETADRFPAHTLPSVAEHFCGFPPLLDGQNRTSNLGVLFFLLDEENSLPPPVREAHIQSEVRQGSCELPQAIRGMPGSEFEPRSPLQNVLMKDAAQKNTARKCGAFTYNAPFLE